MTIDRAVKSVALALSVSAVLGCGTAYYYAPRTDTGAKLAGRPAADIPIPPQAPSGDVLVATFGISELSASGVEQKVSALHLREIITNGSKAPWTVDTRSQQIILGDRGNSRAAYASADTGAPPPVVTVPPGCKRTVDLFFPLPADMSRAGTLPEFDAVWTVQTDSGTVTLRTPFERLRAEAHDPSLYNWGFWGPPYYYDTDYPANAWNGVSIPPTFTTQPVMASRPPQPIGTVH